MDVLTLSRIQFAFTIAFHYIYPVFSIGLSVLLVVFEWLALKTKNRIYWDILHFWVKIFAIIFTLGVATGVVMEFQIGTNWAAFSRYAGEVFGNALAAEGILAFFLESVFLAILIFGWKRVSAGVHMFSTVMVCLGAHLSAVWIVIAGSWMQTPTGYRVVGEGARRHIEIVDFAAMIFNPSAMDRLLHVIIGCWQAGAFLVLSVGAYYLLKKRHGEFAKKSMTVALVFAVISSVAQLVSGHSSALIVGKHQPAKMAAFEGHYPASAPGDLYVWGWVNEKKEAVEHGLKIPGMLSYLMYEDTRRPVIGLRGFLPSDRPPVNLTFQAYHVMVGLGMVLIGLSIWGTILLYKGKLFENVVTLKLFIWSVLAPQIANETGWISAEVGRQPWLIYGVLRTSEGLSQSINAPAVAVSLICFMVLYAMLFFLFLFMMFRKIQAGPRGVSMEGEG